MFVIAVVAISKYFRRVGLMMITKNNLNNVTFENEDARILILDVVSHTSACLYYYNSDIEITVSMALRIQERAYKADDGEIPYSISLMNANQIPIRKPARRSTPFKLLGA